MGGYASCEHGHHHHLCERCVQVITGKDWSAIVEDPSLYACPICDNTCICAACIRRRNGEPERMKFGGGRAQRRGRHKGPKGSRAQQATKGIAGMADLDMAEIRREFWSKI